MRLIIYEMVLGGKVLHISAPSAKGRILHYVCQDPDGLRQGSSSSHHHHHHVCSEASRPSSAPRDEYAEVTGLLPLLVTCRRIYSEAIGTLYRANTFEFTQNFAAFTFLKIMVPPQRLHAIRHFRLHLRVPRHPALNARSSRDWNDLWAFFASDMTGLQSFYLHLQMLQPMEAFIESTKDDAAESWMRPMIVMAVGADERRGCRVQIVTRRVYHEPAVIFKQIAREYPGLRFDDVVRHASEKLHAQIRISLGADG